MAYVVVVAVQRQLPRTLPEPRRETVTIIIEDTRFRILHNEVELKLVSRKNPGKTVRFKAIVRPRK